MEWRLSAAGVTLLCMQDRYGATTEPLWGVGQVSRRLGVAAPTLRTWDRRYGLSPRARTVGGHRRYSELDVARLARTCQLIAAGVPPAQAALMAIGSVHDADAAPRPEPPSVRRASLAPGGAPVTIEVLLRAAHALDAPTLAAVLEQVFDRHGVLAGWTDVVSPFLGWIGEQRVAGGCGIETEQLASECVSTELRHRLRDSRPAAVSRSPVLLAGACGDRHALSLVTLAVALSDRRVPTRMLGCCLPFDALLSAVERVLPRAVFLWSSLAAGAQRGDLGGVRAVTPEPVLLLGGPGWPSRRRGPRAPQPSEWVPDLGTAVDRISALSA